MSVSKRIDELGDLDGSDDEKSEIEEGQEPAEAESVSNPESDLEPDPDPEPNDSEGNDDESMESEPMSTSAEDESTEAESTDTASIEESEPAYSGDDFSRQTIYRRDETWNEYQDAMDELDLLLMRRKYGVRNVTGREREEAMVKLARDNPELIAEYVFVARGFDVDVPKME